MLTVMKHGLRACIYKVRDWLCRFVAVSGAVIVASGTGLRLTVGADGVNFKPVVTPADGGGFEFNTGVLRGKIARGGQAVGLTEVMHVPTGARLDSSMGLLSHYRVFTRGRRYGAGAWEWPCKTRQLTDRSVEITWEPDVDRPFEMHARYDLRSPTEIDLQTTVLPFRKLEAFEVFIASYFSGAFTNSMVVVRDGEESGGTAVLKRAVQEAGLWQMYARDKTVYAVITDGRWKLPPHPVDWMLYPVLAKPIGVRRAESLGLTIALLGTPDTCFAVAMPHETEVHYSVYLSQWGCDLEPGKPVTATTRLKLIEGDIRTGIAAAYNEFAGARSLKLK